MCLAAVPMAGMGGMGEMWCLSATPLAGTWGAAREQALSGWAWERWRRVESAWRSGGGAFDCCACRHAGRSCRWEPDRPCRGRAAGCDCAWRAWGAWQQAVLHLRPTGAAVFREGDLRRGGLDRGAVEAARRRRAGGAAQRRQVLVAGAVDAGGAEGRGLPVHDALARAGDDRRGGSPGRGRRHPRPDRRRGGGRWAGARVPRPRRALLDAGPPGRLGAGGGRS